MIRLVRVYGVVVLLGAAAEFVCAGRSYEQGNVPMAIAMSLGGLMFGVFGVAFLLASGEE